MRTERATLRALERETAECEPGDDHIITAEVKLELAIADVTHVIWGANVDRIALRMTRYGLAGELGFWVGNDEAYGGEEKDELYDAFQKSDLIEVKLSILAVRPDDEDDNTTTQKDPQPFVIKGLVSGREVYEQAYRGTDKPAPLARRYGVTFVDAAALLWKQHFPCALYTEKTIKDILEEHKVAAIAMTYEGESLTTTKKPLLFLGLSPVERRAASFYDWLIWLCDARDLLFTYKYTDQSYRLAEQLEEPPTEKTVLARLDIEKFWVRYAETPRMQVQVLNGASSDPRTQLIATESALAPISQDYLIRTPLGAEFDARGTLETQRLRSRGPTLHVTFAKLPLRLFGPGDGLDLTTELAGWDTASLALPTLATTSALRCSALRLSLRGDVDLAHRTELGDTRAFRMHCEAELEPESERAPHFPEYVTPRYPRLVEGLVLSGPDEAESGGEAGGGGDSAGGGEASQSEEFEETYEVERNEETSLQRYQVKLPLFANQIVRVPFDPGTLSGHFYFPIYKNARVLIALDCERAILRSFLDWRIGNQLPQESQGNQLMMGKKPSSSVVLQTVYTDDKVVFTLQRTSDKDIQTIQIAEGKLTVFVGEGKEDTAAEKIKTTHIAIDKNSGLSVKIENPDSKLTQTVTLDGTTLTLKVEGEEDSSTYTQTADAIAIKAKTLTIEGETLSLKTSKASTWISEDTLSLTSSKDMAFTSDAALNQTAAGAGKFEADTLSLKATNAATLEGSDTAVKGSSSLKGEAPDLVLDGATASTVKGATVEINASGALTCKAATTTTVKGAMVTISGNLIQVG